MQVRNTSARILLALALWEFILPVKSKPRIKCGPGLALQKSQDGHNSHCIPCPSGQFSKGYNSVCHPCHKCHRNRVKKTCTATQDTVCKHTKAQICSKYWKKKTPNHLMKYCLGFNFLQWRRCKMQFSKCVFSKDENPGMSAERRTPVSKIFHDDRTEQAPVEVTRLQRNNTNKDHGKVDKKLDADTDGTTSVDSRTHQATTTAVFSWYRSDNISTDLGIDLEEKEGYHLNKNQVLLTTVITFGVAALAILLLSIMYTMKKAINNKGKSQSNTICKGSESYQNSVVNSVVLFDTNESKSRTALLTGTSFPDDSHSTDEMCEYIIPQLQKYKVSSSTPDGHQMHIVQPSPKRPVIQNEYFPFPSTDTTEKNKWNSSPVSEACAADKRAHISSISSGCSDMSRHGQRVDSDEDSLCFSDECWANTPDVFNTGGVTTAPPENESSTKIKVCQKPAFNGSEEYDIQMRPVTSLDTVVPTCREAVLKPREATCVDQQKHVALSCDITKSESTWSSGKSSNCDTNTDQGRHWCLSVEETSTVENDDDSWSEFLKSRKENLNPRHGNENVMSDVIQARDCKSSCYRNQIDTVNQEDTSREIKRNINRDPPRTAALSEAQYNGRGNLATRTGFLQMRSIEKNGTNHDYVNCETLNNWSCHPHLINTDSACNDDKEAMLQFESVYGSDTENTTGDISDRNSSDMTTSTSDSTSPYQSSDELMSTSSTPEPVTYVQIHNKYSVKDGNKTANKDRKMQVLVIDDTADADAEGVVLSTPNESGEPQNSEDIRPDPVTSYLDICNSTQHIGDSQQRYQNHQADQHNDIEGHSTTRYKDRTNTAVDKMKETSYEKIQQCKSENLHETLHKTESTQTHHNLENMQTIFGQKWDVRKYFSSQGGQLTKSTTNMSLTVFEDSVTEGETVLVGGRFTGNSLDVLPYLDEGWAVISPLAEFQMTYRKRWDKHAKIYIPYYPHNPKEIMRVCYYHRTEKGNIEHGDVPLFDDSKNQDMYFVQTPDHVEIYTVTFTMFHCACDHTFPLFLTSMVFTLYNQNENEAIVRLHVGDTLLKDPLVSKELEDKERQQHGTTLNQSKPVRLLQCREFAGDSRLVFKIDFPPNRSRAQGHTVSDTVAACWENLFPQDCSQIQERRFCELVRCMCQCRSEGKMAAKCASTRHDCRQEIEWTYTSTVDPCPDQFSCTVSITHDLRPGQDADRHDRCQEGITWYRLKAPHGDSASVVKQPPRNEEFAYRELPSDWKSEDPYCGLKDNGT